MTSTEIDSKKYQDYRKRIREIEEENETITVQLAKARHNIKRLRIERIVLLDEIHNLKSKSRPGKKVFSAIDGAESDSEMSISELSDVKPHRKSGPAAPKKKRDPNAPKGPGNVFFLYCRMERDNIKDKVPNESLGEVTRLLGQKWKALSKEEKQKYYDMYKKEQEDYETAMKSYTAAGGGIEGAAAVEAAAQRKHEEESNSSQLHMDDEEIDMLDDDDDDEEDDDEEDMMDDKLSISHAIVSPPSSIASTPLPETPQNQVNSTNTSTF